MTHGATLVKSVSFSVRSGTVQIADERAAVPTPIRFDPVIVGRSAPASFLLTDPEVSNLHCELKATAEGIVLRDLGSKNGTFVAGIRVRDVLLVEPTDVLVGNVRLRVGVTKEREALNVSGSERFGGLVGNAPSMRRIFSILEHVAKSELSLLILGETGTGKEVVAQSVHAASSRSKGPFVVVDCGSIPEALAESLLFGHEKGAFTGATERRSGALAEANGGTLFLDELGELPIDLQPKLLRALAERQVRRVGASHVEPIDVRVLAATRRDLGREMNAGRFRSDLFFRIAQVRLELPPLRERLLDLEMLVREACARVGSPGSHDAVWSWIGKRMSNYDWPGNVRELVNVVQVAAALAHSPETIDDVLLLSREPKVRGNPGASGDTSGSFADAKKNSVAAFERAYFQELSSNTNGNISEMARRSGMERHHVRAFLRKYDIRTESL
jgi:DNA-binding NtrC family response regulator